MGKTLPADANQLVQQRLNECAEEIEKVFDADSLSYYGPLIYGVDQLIRDEVESREAKKPRLVVFINTTGGYFEESNCQMLWMTAASGGFGLFHPIDKPGPGNHLGQQR